MHEPNLFQGATLVLMAALTASAPTREPYTHAENRLAAVPALDMWPEMDKHQSLIAHCMHEVQPGVSPRHVDVDSGVHGQRLHHRGHLS